MGLSSPDGGGAPGSPDIGSVLSMIGGGGGGGNAGTYNNSTSTAPLPPWANGSGNGTFGAAAPGHATAPPPGHDLASLLQGAGGRGGPPMPPQAAGTPGTGFMSILAALMGNKGSA